MEEMVVQLSYVTRPQDLVQFEVVFVVTKTRQVQ